MTSGSRQFFDDLAIGLTFTTTARTITETDLVMFTTITGLTEEIFVNKNYRDAGDPADGLVPGILTLSYAEGLVAQVGWLRGSGQAFIAMDNVSFRNPTLIGYTIHCVGEVIERSRSRSGARGQVTFGISVRNDNDLTLLDYQAVRLVSARPKR